MSCGKEEEKKAATLCRRALHRVNNGRRLLLIAGKEVTKKNLQDEGDGKEKQAGEYVALQSQGRLATEQAPGAGPILSRCRVTDVDDLPIAQRSEKCPIVKIRLKSQLISFPWLRSAGGHAAQPGKIGNARKYAKTAGL